MKCVVCEHGNTTMIKKDYPGYIAGTKFDIFSCANCSSHFIKTKNINSRLYDIIYSSSKTPGYDRYFRYSQQVKLEKDPLKFLATEEPCHFPVFKNLCRQKNLKILEVGCGYGYLTYALNQAGHRAFGIDISKSATNIAKNNFGEHFSCSDLGFFIKKTKNKFDVVVATEVVEHVADPREFIKECLSVLKDNGKIILTTPNKDYSPSSSTWDTDGPPVHTTWLSKKGFETIASSFGLKADFIDFSDYYPKNENKLMNFLLSRKMFIQDSVLMEDGSPNPNRRNPSTSALWKFARFILVDFTPVRILFNFAYNLIFRKKYQVLGVVLSKNKNSV